MSQIIDIATIISQDLKSRSSVHDLLLFIKNSNLSSVEIDFLNVKFATRSFIDEYYNTFELRPIPGIETRTVNIPTDIQYIFDAVKRTQTKVKHLSLNSSIIKCNNEEDLRKVLTSLAL